jgi:hypothetical protein
MADSPGEQDKPTEETKPVFPPVVLTSLRLKSDERGRLFVVRDGHEDQQVMVRRAFPWSIPGEFISLRDKDGTELAMIESLDILPAETRSHVERFLVASTFIPKINRIEKINLEHGYQLWDVESEAGSLQLRVQEREDIRFLSDSRFSVKDANGNVYEIANVNELDEQSQRELSRVV